MYRAVIEHPQWIPKDWQKKLDLRAGARHGPHLPRLSGGQEAAAIPRLDKLDTAGLVAALDSPNGWQRDMAQMMLVWKADKAAVPLSKSWRRRARTRWPGCTRSARSMASTRCRPKALLAGRCRDAHPGVRRHAVRLCEGRFGEVGRPRAERW